VENVKGTVMTVSGWVIMVPVDRKNRDSDVYVWILVVDV
jgi:hypothetical protein